MKGYKGRLFRSGNRAKWNKDGGRESEGSVTC